MESTDSGPKLQSPRVRSRLAELLGELADGEGLRATSVPGVEVGRVSAPSRRKPLIYEPMLLFLGQGRKRARLGDEVIEYGPGKYLALSVPVPVECEVVASPEEPLLALKLAVEPEMLADILIKLDEPGPLDTSVPRGICARPMTRELDDALIRLLECLRSPVESRILGHQIVREIVFRVLQDQRGGALRALATRSDQFMRIARVLNRMREQYSQPLNVEALAGLASMSTSTFHQHFKAVTGTSPLQYFKSIRLHRARLMMIHADHTASSVAAAVGYESASQFGREFKRLFGRTPGEEASAAHERLAGGVEEARDRWVPLQAL